MLGDTLLGSAITIYLFTRFPGRGEAFYSLIKSELASNVRLGRLAEQMGFDQAIIQGSSMRQADVNYSVLSGCLEAFCGALYLSIAGYAAGAASLSSSHSTSSISSSSASGTPTVTARSGEAWGAVLQWVTSALDQHVNMVALTSSCNTAKSRLHEILQACHVVMECRVEAERPGAAGSSSSSGGGGGGVSGGGSSAAFLSVVSLEGRELGRGSSGQKKDAEQRAAYDAISRMPPGTFPNLEKARAEGHTAGGIGGFNSKESYKNYLQEHCQRVLRPRDRTQQVVYTTSEVQREDRYIIAVYAKGAPYGYVRLGLGMGPSKQAAEEEAAQEAIDALQDFVDAQLQRQQLQQNSSCSVDDAAKCVVMSADVPSSAIAARWGQQWLQSCLSSNSATATDSTACSSIDDNSHANSSAAADEGGSGAGAKRKRDVEG